MKKITLLLVMLLAVVGVNAKTVYTEEHNVGSWNALQLKASDYPVLATASAGDVVAVTISNVNDARITLQTTGYGSLGEYDEYHCNEGVHYFVLTESAANEVKTNGLNVSGENYTVNKVELLYKKTLWSGELNGLETDWKQSDGLENSIFSELVSGVPLGVTVSAKSSTAEWNGALVRIDYASNIYEVSFEGASTKVKQLTASDVKSLQTKSVNLIARYLTITELNTYTQMKQEEGTVAVSIGEDGIATFSYSSNLSFENTGITPYYASSVSEGTVNLTPMTTTWGWQGYVLKGDPGIYYVPTVDNEQAEYPTQPNYLQQMVNGGRVYRSAYSEYSGDNEENIKKCYRYIFAKNNSGEIGFYKLATDFTEGGNPYHTLGAHKAYLETEEDVTPDEVNARVALIFDDGEATSISEKLKVKSEKFATATDCYDLMGRKVAQPTRGLYIVNGKKVVVR